MRPVGLSKVPRSPFAAVAGGGEGCGLLAFGQVQAAVSHPEIRGVPEAPRGGRSLAVFSEGVDSGPSDPGKAPEACEIGGTRMPSGRPL